MDLGIAGKRALVTGASQGIGRTMAFAFANEGCRVALIARRDSELKDVVDEIGGRAKGHDYYPVDLMKEHASVFAVQALMARGGDFDIVIHNVGGTLNVKDSLAPSEDWAKVWRFNVGIAIDINGVVIPRMQKKKWGRIVHISSISGENLRGAGPYGAAKAYLNAYTRVLGRAFAPDGIVISALMPGAIYAPGGHWDENSSINAKDTEAFLRKRADFLRHHHAIERLGKADEIAPFAVFMASEQVTFATTSVIPIDGGTM